MIKPLSATRTLTAEGALNRRPKGQKITANMTPHSAHGAERSQHYHQHVAGRMARVTDQLNPDRTLSAQSSNTVGAAGMTGPGPAN